jgi:hypothetical protein
MITSNLRRVAISLFVAVPFAISACGGNSGTVSAARARVLARWAPLAHLRRPVDLVGPLPSGDQVVAGAGRLSLLGPAGMAKPFPSARGAYRSPGGAEPYVALSPGGCYGTGNVYALRLAKGRGVAVIGAAGGVRELARVSAPGLLDGIAFDQTGSFGHQLLVTITAGGKTTVDAINCRGAITTITRSAPRVEGGIAVAPASFGRFAGDLIAPSETTGRIFAITPKGTSLLVADSGLPHGGDIGVESEGFVPAGSADALVADRLTPGNPHPGDDAVLRIPGAALRGAGVRPGDLLVAAEGGALTDAVSCSTQGCRVVFVAQGPAAAHLEGHIAFGRSR